MKGASTSAPAQYEVTEGVEGYWHYHLSPAGAFTRSLCGRSTMRTSIRLDAWGKTPPDYHIPQKWCAECARLAGLASEAPAAVETKPCPPA
jgi:hypothetical protein